MNDEPTSTQATGASAHVVRRPHTVHPSRGLPQVPHVEEEPVRVTAVPRVVDFRAHNGQELPALCRLEQVEMLRRAAGVDVVVQQAALLGVPHLQRAPLAPYQQAVWPLRRLEGQHTSDVPLAAEVVEEREGLAIPHPGPATKVCHGDAVVPPHVLLPHDH
jgi:hypothetical protein